MKYILALDQGTTSSRALLIDRAAKIKYSAQKEFRQIFPQPGWVEHDPKELWVSQASVITEVLAHSDIKIEEIAAVGITNQRETTIVWDGLSGEPIANAIVWQDRRTTDHCHTLKKEGLEPLFTKKTGLVLDPYFSGTKLHWILKSVPGAMEKARRGLLKFGTVDSWLVWKLTGGKKHITDATNASRTLLYNIHSNSWDKELLEILEIPESILPKVCSSSEVYGHTATSTIGAAIPISGIAGDQQAALIGQGCLQKGMAKTTYGTGCFLLMHTGDSPILSKNRLLTTIAYQINGKTSYALEGSVFNAGTVVQWLRDELGLIKNSEEIESLASKVTGSEGVVFVPAFTGLGAPHWDPHARGTIVGLTRGSNAGHIARAALESIAFQVMDTLKAMQDDSDVKIQELRVDGGAVKNRLLMQFQADLLGFPVVRPNMTELTAIGAAYLAGLGVGFWDGFKAISTFWQAEQIFLPNKGKADIQLLVHQWEKALHCAQMWGKE